MGWLYGSPIVADRHGETEQSGHRAARADPGPPRDAARIQPSL